VLTEQLFVYSSNYTPGPTASRDIAKIAVSTITSAGAVGYPLTAGTSLPMNGTPTDIQFNRNDDTLWVATGGGLGRIDQSTLAETFYSIGGFDCARLYVDSTDAWLSASGGNLYRFTLSGFPSAPTVITTPDGSYNGAVTSDGDFIYVGSYATQVIAVNPGDNTYTTITSLPGITNLGATQNDTSSAWFATNGWIFKFAGGVYTSEAHNTATGIVHLEWVPTPAPALLTNETRSYLSCRHVTTFRDNLYGSL
jgi:hypothetical protein